MNKKQDVKNGVRPIVQAPIAQIEGLPAGYTPLLEELKERIRTAQVKAALSVNRELITLYWEIGKCIVERQRTEGWGKAIVGPVSEGPGGENFRASLDSHPQHLANARFLPRLVRSKLRTTCERNERVISATGCGRNTLRGHNIALIEKLKNPPERLWYARQTVEHGWSRNVLVHQIESGLYRRQGGAISNFHATLPAAQSDLAHQLLKDPNTFDFLMLTQDAQERALEQGLVEHIQKFLLELGIGFASVGRQYHLDVGGEDSDLDLLFYHVQLRCFVVIDLKAEKFKPEFAGN